MISVGQLSVKALFVFFAIVVLLRPLTTVWRAASFDQYRRGFGL